MAYGYFLGENVYRLTRPVGLVMIVLGLLIIASQVFVHCNERRVEGRPSTLFLVHSMRLHL